MSKSQMIDRRVNKIDDDFVYIEYLYEYVDEKDEIEKKRGDFKGFHPIGKTIHKNIKCQFSTKCRKIYWL